LLAIVIGRRADRERREKGGQRERGLRERERGGGLEVIQTWFNSGSGMEARVSQLRHVGLVSIVRRGD
jgi:hypothetical protein